MTDYILKCWPRFGNYLALFEPFLGKPAQRHFRQFLMGFILYLGTKNVTGLNRATFNPSHLSSLDRFLTEGTWDANHFDQIRMQHLNRQVRRFLDNQTAKNQSVPAFLCIDDTNNPKVGDKTPWVGYQYSHLAGRNILCWCLVTAVMVVGHYTMPCSFRLYRLKADCEATGQPQLFRTKVELAIQLIQEWQPPVGTTPYVVVDNWYTSAALLEACAAHHFTLIGGVKGNRTVLRTGQPGPQKLNRLGPTLAQEAYQKVTIGKQTWHMAGLDVQLAGGCKVKLVASKALQPAKSKPSTLNYWVCTDTRLGVRTIMELYSVRWEIETFHKQAKQLLGLNHNQCRCERSITRLWTLLLLAHSYLMLERVEHSSDYQHSIGKELPSLGQVQREHQRLGHQAMVEWSYAEASAGTPLAALLAQIRA
jgi:hypothetical protein